MGYAYAALEGNDFMALHGPAGVLYDLLIDGAGIGRQLVETIIAKLTDLGTRRIVLSTAARNAGAQQLFIRLGISADGDRDDARPAKH